MSKNGDFREGPQQVEQIDRRRFYRMIRDAGVSVLIALPFLGRLFGSDRALARTPTDQLAEKFGDDLVLRSDDKFADDIIGRPRPKGETDDKPIQVAYNRFSRAYNRFGRAYNRFSR
jgi:hypothetical protein